MSLSTCTMVTSETSLNRQFGIEVNKNHKGVCITTILNKYAVQQIKTAITDDSAQ